MIIYFCRRFAADAAFADIFAEYATCVELKALLR